MSTQKQGSLTGSESDVGSAVLLEARSVSKYFPLGNPSILSLLKNSLKNLPHFQALDRVSCEVRKGEFLGILGRNGAGKSTFLRVLGDVLPPEEGVVLAHGDRFGIYELGDGANPFLTGREYTLWWLRFQGVRKEKVEAFVEEVKQFSELEEYFDQPVRTYSAGMSARLYFSAVNCLDASILLIDEALAVGDEHFQRKCWKRLRERIRDGASGVLVSHDWVSVVRLCHRTMVLKNGGIQTLDVSQKAVQSYLGTKKEERAISKGARFESCPRMVHAQLTEPLTLECSVVLDEDIEVTIGYSIEYMKPGWGWNIVVLESNLPVASKRGRYSVELTFDRQILARGRYELSLYLSGVDKAGDTIALDALGWVYEDSIALVIDSISESEEGVSRMSVDFQLETEK